jgi:hypothetical protein
MLHVTERFGFPAPLTEAVSCTVAPVETKMEVLEVMVEAAGEIDDGVTEIATEVTEVRGGGPEPHRVESATCREIAMPSIKRADVLFEGKSCGRLVFIALRRACILNVRRLTR